jgi:hypothetical protein
MSSPVRMSSFVLASLMEIPVIGIAPSYASDIQFPNGGRQYAKKKSGNERERISRMRRRTLTSLAVSGAASPLAKNPDRSNGTRHYSGA